MLVLGGNSELNYKIKLKFAPESTSKGSRLVQHAEVGVDLKARPYLVSNILMKQALIWISSPSN